MGSTTFGLGPSFNQNLQPAKEPPRHSQQGFIGTCVAHSLAKSVCAAGLNKNINFMQDEVISQVVQLGGENAAKEGSLPDWSVWNGKSIFPKENGVSADATGGPLGKTFKATFGAQECNLADYNDQYEYVLVLRADQCSTMNAGNGYHCVYVKFKKGNLWYFLNSHGNQPEAEMKIEISNQFNKLYKVDVDIQEIRPDEVLKISSLGVSGTAFQDLIGIYRIVPRMSHENHRIWKMDDKEHRICVNQMGKWVVEKNHGEVMGNMTSPAPISPAGLLNSWMYWDVSTMTWKEDQQLKIEIPSGTTTQGQARKVDQPLKINISSGTTTQGEATKEEALDKMKKIFTNGFKEMDDSNSSLEVFAKLLGVKPDYSDWANNAARGMRKPVELRVEFVINTWKQRNGKRATPGAMSKKLGENPDFTNIKDELDEAFEF